MGNDFSANEDKNEIYTVRIFLNIFALETSTRIIGTGRTNHSYFHTVRYDLRKLLPALESSAAFVAVETARSHAPSRCRFVHRRPALRLNVKKKLWIRTDWPPPMSNLRETLGAVDAFLFKDEAMTPIFCKPKLLPLKTVSVQKLDAMRKEAKSRARTEEVRCFFCSKLRELAFTLKCRESSKQKAQSWFLDRQSI
ncbi:unnamed protein product [Angiostrongylus costaricensis]|uniref:Smr domain-containing protein n=1 Tax=Angiostrongylus costaricensis TaxID=334426 RepID=A0A0R3PUM6_ANGCS|nr:unnamed protein product [Angiostrongylus costaricensis]